MNNAPPDAPGQRLDDSGRPVGSCNCASVGSAAKCPHHTQEDFDAADRAREDAPGQRVEDDPCQVHIDLGWVACGLPRGHDGDHASGQREADAGGEVELMPWPLTNIIHRPDVQRWLAAHDASVVAAARADADATLGEVRALAEKLEAQAVGSAQSAAAREGLTDAHQLSDYSDTARRHSARLRAVLDAAGPRREGTDE